MDVMDAVGRCSVCCHLQDSGVCECWCLVQSLDFNRTEPRMHSRLPHFTQYHSLDSLKAVVAFNTSSPPCWRPWRKALFRFSGLLFSDLVFWCCVFSDVKLSSVVYIVLYGLAMRFRVWRLVSVLAVAFCHCRCVLRFSAIVERRLNYLTSTCRCDGQL